MSVLHIACCLWDANQHSHDFSRCYDESWVEKLYRGFERNLTYPFRFVVFTDRKRSFAEKEISQERLQTSEPHYGCLIEPFRLNVPIIICGLDMVLVRNVDHFAHYCLTASRPALVGHPTNKAKFGYINPVVFCPKGFRRIADDWRGQNDMKYLNTVPDVADANDLWPGQLLSLKLQNVGHGAQPPPLPARIIYMHGRSKPHELAHCGWIREHWV